MASKRADLKFKVDCVHIYILIKLYKLPAIRIRQWYDKVGRPDSNDLTSLTGFLVALRDTLRLRKGALLHGGHPCNM